MKLVIINGPPGAGKSSVAEALHKTLPPLTFLLKFDAQRRFFNQRHEYRLESESLTYQVCKAITETCFQAGKDVIFERVIADAAVLDEFLTLGQKYGAQTFEFILWADKETIIHRNLTRETAADLLPDSKRVDATIAEKFWNLIDVLKDQRPQSHLIDVKENGLEQVIERVTAIVNS